MRVLFVVSGLGLGGAEKQVVLLTNELARRGHDICIYALSDEVPRAEELSQNRLRLVVDPKQNRLDLGVLRRLRAHIRDWRPDIVHGFLFDGNFYARVAAAGLAIPTLDSERNDNYALPRLHALGYLVTSPFTNGLVANSFSGAEFAARNFMRPSKAVHVVWNGIDLQDVDKRLACSDQPAFKLLPGRGVKRLAVVGTIKPQKDLVLALRVARRLVDTDPRWKMVVVGGELAAAKSDYKAAVLRSYDELQLGESVKFAGSRRDVLEVMASCDAVLVTSRHEGFPNVILEAMACGTPVVSTDYSDVRRILPLPWQVVSSRNEDDLVQALLRCDAERATVIAAQRKWVEAHATAALCTDRLLSIYQSYIAQPAAPMEQAP